VATASGAVLTLVLTLFLGPAQKAPKASARGIPMHPAARRAETTPRRPTEPAESLAPFMVGTVVEGVGALDVPEAPLEPFELGKEVVRQVYDESKENLVPARITFDGTGVSINGEHHTFCWGIFTLSVVAVEEPEVGGEVTITADMLLKRSKSTISPEELRTLCHALMYGKREAEMKVQRWTVIVKRDPASESNRVHIAEAVEKKQ